MPPPLGALLPSTTTLGALHPERNELMIEIIYYSILFFAMLLILILWHINNFLNDRQCYQIIIDGETFQIAHHVDISRWSKTVYFIDHNGQEHYTQYYRIELTKINLKYRKEKP